MEYKLCNRNQCRTYPHEYELMAGFFEDSKKLIDQVVELFNRHDSLRFEHFVTVWKEMSFSLVHTKFGTYNYNLSYITSNFTGKSSNT